MSGQFILYIYIFIVSLNAYLLHFTLILPSVVIVILIMIKAAIWLGYYCHDIHIYLYMLILLHPGVSTPPRARAKASPLRVCSHLHHSLTLDPS